jgi:hypothetical protein
VRKLELDFIRGRRGSPWAGRVLLAVAVAVCADVGLSFHHGKEALKQAEARFAQRTPAGSTVRATPQEVAAARETVERLSLPWNDLFAALESAAGDQVVLASIEPDTRAGTVTVTADGTNYLAALSYVANLGRASGLERVQLVRHEQKANDPNGPVRFAVSAAWSVK